MYISYLIFQSNILPANTKESQMSIPVPQKPNSTSLFVGRKDALDKFRKISIHSADSESRSTNVSWSSRTISLHNLLYSSIFSETSTLRRFSTPTPITGVSSGQLGFDRTSLDPPKTFLTPSIFRCAPTSPPMNSIRFLTWKIKAGGSCLLAALQSIPRHLCLQ